MEAVYNFIKNYGGPILVIFILYVCVKLYIVHKREPYISEISKLSELYERSDSLLNASDIRYRQLSDTVTVLRYKLNNAKIATDGTLVNMQSLTILDITEKDIEEAEQWIKDLK